MQAQAAEAQEWKNRFLDLDKKLKEQQSNALGNMELENRLQQLQNDLKNWKDRCFRAERDKQELENQLKQALAQLSAQQPQAPKNSANIGDLQS